MIKISVIVAGMDRYEFGIFVNKQIEVSDCDCPDCKDEIFTQYIHAGFEKVPWWINYNYGLLRATGDYLIFIHGHLEGYYGGWKLDLIDPLVRGYTGAVAPQFLVVPTDEFWHRCFAVSREAFAGNSFGKEEGYITIANKFFTPKVPVKMIEACKVMLDCQSNGLDDVMDRLRAAADRINDGSALKDDPSLKKTSDGGMRIRHDLKMAGAL